MSANWQISRRAVLRGIGASIALPLLDAMMPSVLRSAASSVCSAATTGQAVGTPTRMAFVFFPNGRWMPNWTPIEVGSTFTLPVTLAPLAPVQNNLMVLSNLALANGNAKGDGAGDHARSAASFLTGAHPYKTAGANIKCGISVDQVAAQKIGDQTRLPSLELGLEHSALAGNCDSGYSCAYVSNISWRTDNSPMPQETDPAAVFTELFGSDDPAYKKRLAFRQSILDTVSADAKSLNARIGQNDRNKLDEFTTSIREIERRVEAARNQKPIVLPADVKRPTGIPDNYSDYAKLMYDMMVLAFQMDVTRVSSFMTARDGSDHTYAELGLTEGHHTNSHHGKEAAKIEAVKKIDVFHMELYSYFLQKLQSIREGDGTLLDHCMVLAGSGISDGDKHNHDQLPILLAGRANGAFKPGRHIQFKGDVPLCNLYLSMLNAMDVKPPRFGDSTGTLAELSG